MENCFKNWSQSNKNAMRHKHELARTESAFKLQINTLLNSMYLNGTKLNQRLYCLSIHHVLALDTSFRLIRK